MRGSLERSTQKVRTPLHVPRHPSIELGHHHGMYWISQEFRRFDGHENSAWYLRVSCRDTLFQVPVLMYNRAGFFPAAIYLCSYWYMPKNLATRISYFYCASALSGAFSGLLAAGIAQMDGVGGYEGWRWIFILEGCATVLLGIACFLLLIDTPALSTRWLNPEEIRYLELSMFIKQGGKFREESGIKMKDLKMVLSNWKVYIQAYFLFCQSALSYGKTLIWKISEV